MARSRTAQAVRLQLHCLASWFENCDGNFVPALVLELPQKYRGRRERGQNGGRAFIFESTRPGCEVAKMKKVIANPPPALGGSCWPWRFPPGRGVDQLQS